MISISKNMAFSGRKRETMMRQGDGSDLPGVNEPRKADIGIIYVAPSDDRQSVLTAIHTQDKLGRKQVVIVLPEEKKAGLYPGKSPLPHLRLLLAKRKQYSRFPIHQQSHRTRPVLKTMIPRSIRVPMLV